MGLMGWNRCVKDGDIALCWWEWNSHDAVIDLDVVSVWARPFYLWETASLLYVSRTVLDIYCDNCFGISVLYLRYTPLQVASKADQNNKSPP
jgi:hypothetical protein